MLEDSGRATTESSLLIETLSSILPQYIPSNLFVFQFISLLFFFPSSSSPPTKYFPSLQNWPLVFFFSFISPHLRPCTVFQSIVLSLSFPFFISDQTMFLFFSFSLSLPHQLLLTISPLPPFFHNGVPLAYSMITCNCQKVNHSNSELKPLSRFQIW